MYIINSLIIVHIGCTFDSVPDRHVLLNLLADIKHLWYDIGLALQVPIAKLEGVQQKSLSDINKLSEVLQCWIDQCAEATWQSIITAVRSEIIGQNQISQEIESYVLQLQGSCSHMSLVIGNKGHHTFGNMLLTTKLPNVYYCY